MPDPSTDAPAQHGTATPPPVDSQATSASISDATTQTTALPADPSGLGESHFKHPEYGPALKNLYHGFQDKSGKLAGLEKEHGELKGNLQRLATFLQDPEIATVIRARIARLNGGTAPPTPAATPTEPSLSTEEQQAAEMEARVTNRLKTEQAMNLITEKLGGGNNAFASPQGALFHQLSSRVMADDPLVRAGALLDYFQLAQAAAQNSSSPSPETTLPAGTANSETGRGAPAGGAERPTEIRSGADLYRSLGYASEADYVIGMLGVR